MKNQPVRPVLSLPSQDFRLGPWLIQPAQFKVVGRDGVVVSVEPKMMYVLLCLVQHQGEVVSRDTLMERVWPDVVIVNDTLTRCISELRKLFGDTPDDPQVIETIRKHGYRLLIPPQPVARRKRPLRASSPLEPRVKKPRWISWATFGAAIIIFVYSLGWYKGTRQAHPGNRLVFLDSMHVQVAPSDNVFHLNELPVSSLEAALLFGGIDQDTVAVWHPDPATAGNRMPSGSASRTSP